MGHQRKWAIRPAATGVALHPYPVISSHFRIPASSYNKYVPYRTAVPYVLAQVPGPLARLPGPGQVPGPCPGPGPGPGPGGPIYIYIYKYNDIYNYIYIYIPYWLFIIEFPIGYSLWDPFCDHLHRREATPRPHAPPGPVCGRPRYGFISQQSCGSSM